MINYKYKDIEYVNPVDLQTVHSTLNNLETMHQEAVKTSSELKTAIANLDLNEAEEGFRQQLLNTIETTIDENTKYGNLAGAYDDIVKVQSDIASNPGLIGRLKAQQEYQKYQTAIDASDMPDNYKQYFKSKNPYYYQDTLDSKGNIVGGTKWNPTTTPTKILDYNDIMKQALQYITPSDNSSTIVRFQREDGTITDKLEPGVKAVHYDTITTRVNEITQQELRDALDSAIKANPAILASIKQDWEVAKYDYDNGNQPLYKVNDGVGKYTLEQFKNNIFEPMIKAKAQKNTIYSRIINDDYYKDWALTFGVGNDASEIDQYGYETDTINGPLSSYVDYSSIEAINNSKDGDKKLRTKFYQLTGVENKNISLKDRDSYVNEIFKLPIFKDIPKEIINDREEIINYLSINFDFEDYNTVISLYDDLINEYDKYSLLYAEDIYNEKRYREQNEGNDKALAAMDVKADIIGTGDEDFTTSWDENGEDYIEPSNNYEKRKRNQWSNLVNTFLPDDAVSLSVSFVQDKTLQNFKDAYGLENINLHGIDIKSNGKRHIITLSKENKRYLPKFQKAIQSALDELNFWERQGNIYYTDSEGNKVTPTKRSNDFRQSKIGYTPEMFCNEIQSYLGSLEKQTNTGIGQEKYVESILVPGGNISSLESQYAISGLNISDPEDIKRISNLKTSSSLNNEQILDYIRMASPTNSKIRILDENNQVLVKASGKEAIEYKNALFASDDIGAPGMIFLADEMRWVPYLSFTDEDGKQKHMTFEYGKNSKVDRVLNNDPGLKARSDIMLAKSQNRALKIGSYVNDWASAFFAEPNEDGTFTIKTEYEDFNTINLNNKEQYDMLKSSIMLIDELNYIRNNNVKLSPQDEFAYLNYYIALIGGLTNVVDMNNNGKLQLIKGFELESGIKVNIE